GDRAEDLGAEQPVALRLERPIVDRLGLGDLAVRPLEDALGRGETDPDRVEVRGQLGLVVQVWSHLFLAPRHPPASTGLARPPRSTAVRATAAPSSSSARRPGT